ncbi:MAG: Glu/Leu/Phe/Val dehydrogenase [Bdellovibrionaceae bacterium]|nr:Glu/Leu/Phe/Val dehydrogenase [Pseudobdellovibrionaceae bacterium]
MSFELIQKHGDHEEVIFVNNKKSGLRAIIAIHNTALGPALGGLRMWDYKTEEEALVDVLRLSKGMTYKAAASGLNLGGGKAVIIGNPKKQKTEALFRSLGAFINSLQGRYITAEDIGTTVKDMEYIFMETPYVTGISKALGGSGNPSPHTALGVFMGMQAAIETKLKSKSFKDMRVAIQGAGNVGSHLLDLLYKEGAKVFVSDIDTDKLNFLQDKYPDLVVVEPDKILSTPCEVLAPCALGAVINDESIPNLQCEVIAGAANNQLKTFEHGVQLYDKGILYAPDYVINSGGLINVFVELEGYSYKRAEEKTAKIYDNTKAIFDLAKKRSIPSHQAALEFAENRIKSVSAIRETYHGRLLRPFSHLEGMKNRQK